MELAWITLLVVSSLIPSASTKAGVDKTPCAAVKGATIYSNARYIEEAGDVLGFEIAVFQDGKALLFVYEGGIWGDPFVLTPNESRTLYKGVQKSRLIEHPSERETEVVAKATLSGKFDDGGFRGTITFGDGAAERIRLKKVRDLWGCQ